MKVSRFVSVGENIHCTRIYKVGGLFVKQTEGDNYAISYKAGDETRQLPVPAEFTGNADWESGKVKHCAVAIHQGTKGDEAGKAAGVDYLQNLARKQEAQGATYLDINVDEYSTDIAERIALMQWTVQTVQPAVSIPVSIDSSNVDILRAGLEVCDASRDRPMVNSVSLERTDALKAAKDFNAVVIASAAGKSDLPSTTEGRMENLEKLMPMLSEAGLTMADIHIDPLVFPISVDGTNGTGFLEAVTAIREKYGEDIHIVAGLSNISFGMPKRKLINQVFTYLAVEAGADGGIVDPAQINVGVLENLDTTSEAFRMAKALLTGEDDFGMNFITASREGTI